MTTEETMSSDERSARRAEIEESWKGVESLRDRLKRISMFSAISGALYPHELIDAAQNLPFLHAYSVLCDALHFQAACRRFPYEIKGKRFPNLKPLFNAAKDHLEWGTHQELIESGIELRNQLAHEGALLGRRDCWEHINAIGDVLRKWELVPPLPTRNGQ